MIVDIHIPCYVDQFFPQTAFNVVKVLEQVGCAVNYNTNQTCCGMPAFYEGFHDHSKEVGTKLIHEFQNDRYIVSCGSACADMIKNLYPELFHNSILHNEYKNVQKRIFEFSDFLVNVMNVTDVGASLHSKAVYMDPCTALRGLKIEAAPRKLLQKIKGLLLVELADKSCCGWGGTFACKNEDLSATIAEQKTRQLMETGAAFVISSEMGCLMHLESYWKKNNIPLKALHIADVLASVKEPVLN